MLALCCDRAACQRRDKPSKRGETKAAEDVLSEKISSDLGLVSDTVRNKMNVRSKTEEKVWKIDENAFRVQKKA